MSGGLFVPEGQCGGWPAAPWLAVLYNASDVAIFLSYCVIATIMVGWLRRRHDESLQPIFWLFGAFILTCGTTHLLDFVVFYEPVQELGGWARAVCAIVSVATAALLLPMTPRLMRILPVKELYDRVQRQDAELQQRTREIETMRREIDALKAIRG